MQINANFSFSRTLLVYGSSFFFPSIPQDGEDGKGLKVEKIWLINLFKFGNEIFQQYQKS